VSLFLGLSQPAGLNHPVAGSKPRLASWREPAPGRPIASIYPSTKLESGSCSTSPLSGPRLAVDYKRTWSTWPPDSGATGTERTWRVPDQSWQLKARPPAAFLHEILAPSHRIRRVRLLQQPLARGCSESGKRALHFRTKISEPKSRAQSSSSLLPGWQLGSPPGDHKLLIFQPRFRNARSVARHSTIQSQLLRRQKMTEVLFACFNQSSLRGENLTL
jgi:hypothetical protein